ncbi:MAG: hypothetical protein DRN15_02855 [Thermoprotei archaeon]|nr:MAG: hypothetical protein DRM97_05160 [Thermoprotei archaeon]RLF24343.1 MAG: hypothetical protein DRN15_02855 [Thermoprotei archaeon]
MTKSSPKRLIYFLAFESSPSLRLLEEFIRGLRRSRVRILSLSVTRRANSMTVMAILDFSESFIRPETLLHGFGSMDGIKRISGGIKRAGELASPPFKVEIRALDEKLMFWREEWLSEVVIEVDRTLGTGGKAILYHLGYSEGRRSLRRILKGLVSSSLREILDVALEMLRDLGWLSDYKILDLNEEKPSATIRLWGLVECCRGSGGAPFTKGFLSSIIEHTTKAEVSLTEVRCVSRGDPWCEFTFKPRTRLGK